MKDDADILTTKFGERILIHSAECLPCDGDVAFVRPLKPANGHEQSRFADAGLTTQQQHGTWDKAAPRHTVQFANACHNARGGLVLAIQAFQRKDAALACANGLLRANAGRGRLFNDGIPLATGLAATDPALA